MSTPRAQKFVLELQKLDCVERGIFEIPYSRGLWVVSLAQDPPLPVANVTGLIRQIAS